ncbi:MAG: 30S ribosome-binding factor RbfA [Flavobacteriaceae bacterium]|nr:30S ribosome-binding factor RbfA [Flavobacteriaceae bacterium]
METQRQRKISTVIQKDIADILQGSIRAEGVNNLIISVTKVAVTVDLSIARVYLSIFPSSNIDSIIEGVRSNKALIKHELAQRTRNQLRRVPDLEFFVDDSLDYIEKIDQSLKGTDNPILDPDLLDKRKKS